MKRRLTKLAVFLVLGAVVNVAVAWGCASWSADGQIYEIEPFDENHRFRTVDDDMLIWLEECQWSITEDQIVTFGDLGTFGYYRREFFVLRRSTFPHFPEWSGGFTGSKFPAEFLRHTYAGWPLLSLDGEEWIESYESRWDWMKDGNAWNTEPYDAKWVHYVQVPVEGNWGGAKPMHMLRPRPIPFRPVWPGFAINTTLFAATLWLLTLGPFAARRMIRSKRGHCIKCGYDLRSNLSSGCPECGWLRGTARRTHRLPS